jgi:hypothetical protein
MTPIGKHMSMFIAVSSQECAVLFITVVAVFVGLFLYRVSMKFEESLARGAAPVAARSRSYRIGFIAVVVAVVASALVWIFQFEIFYRWLGVGGS